MLLRAFRPGSHMLSNADLAERCKLPRPTVSRLCRSLVDAGFLAHDSTSGAYKLSAAVLSLALAHRESDATLEAIRPFMRQVAEGRQVNVGLAVADHLEMVYLESIRLSRLGLFRRVQPGVRIPIPFTALGNAFVAGLAPHPRERLMRRLAQTDPARWSVHKALIDKGLKMFLSRGYCHACWSTGLHSVAAPFAVRGNVYALNISFAEPADALDQAVQNHGALLLDLVQHARSVTHRLETC